MNARRREVPVGIALARRRESRGRIVLDPEAQERMRRALAALDLTNPTPKENP